MGEKFHRYPLSNTFWTSCPELRGGVIKQWLVRQGLAPWPHRAPPKLVLTPLGGNRFRLGVPRPRAARPDPLGLQRLDALRMLLPRHLALTARLCRFLAPRHGRGAQNTTDAARNRTLDSIA